jgi:hypothetical protein
LKTIDWLVGQTNVAVIQLAQAQAGGVIYGAHLMFVFETDQDDLLKNIWLLFEDPDEVDRLFAKAPRKHAEPTHHSPDMGDVGSPDSSTS